MPLHTPMGVQSPTSRGSHALRRNAFSRVRVECGGCGCAPRGLQGFEGVNPIHLGGCRAGFAQPVMWVGVVLGPSCVDDTVSVVGAVVRTGLGCQCTFRPHFRFAFFARFRGATALKASSDPRRTDGRKRTLALPLEGGRVQACCSHPVAFTTSPFPGPF